MVIRALFVLISLVTVASPATALNWPQPPEVEADSWALIDARSGQVLAAHAENRELPPASLTKMMTLYLALEDLKFGRLSRDEQVNVSRKAWKMGGSTMFLDPRLHPTVEELLHGIATLSGNDACIALAEHIAGTEAAFAERMNRKAQELGLTHTRFVNATGFPAEGHHSSALDMARLGAALWRDFPERYSIFSERRYTFNKITQPNRNRLLWTDPRVDGIKTGHTEQAGFCLVSSAEREQTRLVAAVFGAKSEAERERQSKVLLSYGFRNFLTLRPAERDIRRRVEVYEGTENGVWLIPAEKLWLTVPRGYESKVAYRLRYAAPVRAPIDSGDRLGRIEAVIRDDDGGVEEVLASVRMQAADAVERASWIKRKWDAMRLWWQSKEQAKP